MSDYILAIDQGTTGTTVLILDEKLQLLASVNREFAQVFPQPGWVEHDPEAIWQSVLDAIGEAVARGPYQHESDRRHWHHKPA